MNRSLRRALDLAVEVPPRPDLTIRHEEPSELVLAHDAVDQRDGCQARALLILRKVIDPEALEEHPQVGLHGVDGQVDLVGDGLVGVAGGCQDRGFMFGGSQVCSRVDGPQRTGWQGDRRGAGVT